MSVPVRDRLYVLVKSVGRGSAGYHQTLRMLAEVPCADRERIGGWMEADEWGKPDKVSAHKVKSEAKFDKTPWVESGQVDEFGEPVMVKAAKGGSEHSAFSRNRYRLEADFTVSGAEYKIVELYVTDATRAEILERLGAFPQQLIEISARPAPEFRVALAQWKSDKGIVDAE